MAAGAGVTLARLMVRVGVASSSFVRDMKSLERSVRQFGDTVGSVGRGMTAGVSLPLAAVGGTALKMAMEVGEAENLFAVSFGEMADAARTWSEGLRTQLGANAQEVRKSAATYYVMLSSMGLAKDKAYELATGLVQLGLDMSSFYNMAPEAAFEKLRAGIMGEAEPLKQLGILVDATSVKQLTLQDDLEGTAGVLARYQAIVQQTSVAQGDLARTIDSPMNQLRRLQNQFSEIAVRLGESLIPTFQAILPVVERFGRWIEAGASAFERLSPQLQAAVIGFGLLVVAAGPALAAIGFMVTGIASLSASTIGVVAVVVGLAGALAAAWALGRDQIVRAWAAIQETFTRVLQIIQPALEDLRRIGAAAFRELGTIAGEQFQKVLTWAKEVWPTVRDLVVKAALLAQAAWDACGRDIVAAVRRDWIAIKTTIGSTLDLVLGVIKAALEALNGDWSKSLETLKTTAAKVWDGVGRYFQAGCAIAASFMWGLAAAVGEVAIAILERLATMATAFAAMPFLNPALKAAALAGLAQIKDGIAGIQGVVEHSQEKAQQWADEAAAVLAPLNQVKQEMDAVPAAAEQAMTSVLSIVDAKTGEMAGRLSGGFGRAADDFGSKFSRAWDSLTRQVADTRLSASVVPQIDSAAFQRELDRLGLELVPQGAGGGNLPKP